MSKKKIKAFIHFNWYKYLLIFVLCFVVFYYIFDIAKKPTYDEQISIFVSTEYISDEFSKDMYSKLNAKEILEVHTVYFDPEKAEYPVMFQTRGIVNNDIVILNEMGLRDMDYLLFADLSSSYFTNYFDCELNYYVYEEKKLGIDVTDVIKPYLREDDGNRYYAFFLVDSNKIGQLGTEAIGDYALEAIANLFKTE